MMMFGDALCTFLTYPGACVLHWGKALNMAVGVTLEHKTCMSINWIISAHQYDTGDVCTVACVIP